MVKFSFGFVDVKSSTYENTRTTWVKVDYDYMRTCIIMYKSVKSFDFEGKAIEKVFDNFWAKGIK